MKLVKIALVTILAVSPAVNAQAESNESFASKLTDLSRTYQQATAEEKVALKDVLQELSKSTDEFLSETASTGETVSAELVDAAHQVKSLLNA